MISLIGKKFGKLSPIEYKGIDRRGRGIWLCQCDCGATAIVVTGNLNIGKTKSCGCLKTGPKRDLSFIGKRYNNITLTKFIGQDKDRGSIFEYVCDCGKIGQIRRNALGKTESCKDCYYLRKNNGYMDISGWYLSSIKNGADNRNLEFSVGIEYLWELFINQNKKCFYTGREIYFVDNPKNRHLQTASLDRINNNQGYVIGNLCWVHREINIFKSKNSHQYFLDLCNEVIVWQNQQI